MTAAPGDTESRLVLLADDMTGAAECAAAFALHRNAEVVLRSEARWPDTHVVAVDTDTRHASATVAASRVATAVRRAHTDGAAVVKKIDSTLRGNVGVEIRAALGALQGTAESSTALALVAPAHPLVGRTTLNARLHVHGVAATTAPFAGDLAALLRQECMRVQTVPLSVVRDLDRLRQSIALAADDRPTALVLDTECDDDLTTIGRAIADAQRRLLVVGSAGIVRAMARVARPVVAPAPPEPPFLREPALFVVGSYSAPARAQRLALVRGGAHPVILRSAHGRLVGAAVDEVATALRAGQSVVLSPDPDAAVDPAAASAMAARLALVAAAVLDDVRTLVVTGGETSRAVMLMAGIETLAVLGEREAGVVGLHAPGRHLDIVTKAGGFGDPAALSRVIWPATSKET